MRQVPPATDRDPTDDAGATGGATRLPKLQEDIAIILWPSFLVAAVETMAFFATFDPIELYEKAEVLREAFEPRAFAYTIGFFFFWALTASASALTLFLARSGHGTNERKQP